MSIPVFLIVFVGLVALGMAALGFALATGHARWEMLATRREAMVALKLVAILLLLLATLYVTNTGRYTGVDFIYGRF